MDRIKVVIFEPGKPGRIDFIPNKLKNMQRVVGGYIESVHLTRELVCIAMKKGGCLACRKTGAGSAAHSLWPRMTAERNWRA